MRNRYHPTYLQHSMTMRVPCYAGNKLLTSSKDFPSLLANDWTSRIWPSIKLSNRSKKSSSCGVLPLDVEPHDVDASSTRAKSVRNWKSSFTNLSVSSVDSVMLIQIKKMNV